MSSLSETIGLIKTSFLLNEREVLVYEACTTEGFLNPSQISELTGIKRTSVYLVIEELKKKGLLVEKIKGKRKSIGIAPPETLQYLINQEQKRVEQKSNAVKSIVSFLKNSQKNSGEKTEVELLEGKNSLILLLAKTLEQKQNAYWLGNLDIALQIIDENKLYRLSTWRRMDTKMASYGITNRKILSSKKFGERAKGFRELRFLPDDFDIPAAIVIFGDSVGLISVHKKDLKITLIKDSSISAIIKYMFDALWQSLPKE